MTRVAQALGAVRTIAAVLACTSPAAAQQGFSSTDMPTVTHVVVDHGALGADREVIEQAIAARQWDEAARMIVKSIDRTPRSPELLTLLGRVFLLANRPLNAAVAFKKAEAIAPLDADTRFSLALAYVAMGRGDWAQPELERLTAADPTRALYTYWLGRLDYDAGRYASAITRFKHVLEADPTSVRAHDNLGLCYDAQHQPELAIASHERAVELNRRAPAPSPWPLLNLAVLRRQQGEWLVAESLLREALQIDPALARGQYELGTVLELRGANDEALASLRKAATLSPDYAEPHYAMARILRRLGRTTQADAAMATFLQLRDARVAGR